MPWDQGSGTARFHSPVEAECYIFKLLSLQMAVSVASPQVTGLALGDHYLLGGGAGGGKVQANGRIKPGPQHPTGQDPSLSPKQEATGSAATLPGKTGTLAVDATRLFQGSPLGGPGRVVQPIHHPHGSAVPAAAATAQGLRPLYNPYQSQQLMGTTYPMLGQHYPVPGVHHLPPNRNMSFNPYLGAPLGGPRVVSAPNHPLPDELAMTFYQTLQKLQHQQQQQQLGHSMASPSTSSPSSRRSQSPAVAEPAPGNPQLQFLPGVCNVHSSAASGATKRESSWRQHNGSRLLTQGQSLEEQILLRNPHLQRELYSYILQTEGEEKAGSFMLQQSGQQLHQPPHAGMLQSTQARVPVNQTGYPQHQPVPSMNSYLGIPDMRRKEGVTISVKMDDSSRSTSRGSVSSFSTLGWENASDISSSGQSSMSHRDHSHDFGVYNNSAQLTPFARHPAQAQNMRQQQLTHAQAMHAFSGTRSQAGSSCRLSHTDCQFEERDAEPPPPAVQHMMRLLDNGLEEQVTETELANIHTGQAAIKIPTIHQPPASERPVPLYMRRPGRVPATSAHLSYAGALRSQPTSGSSTPQGDGLQALTPQTPHTPGNNTDNPFFRKAEAEQPDPLELLKNLNIKASPGTQALYQYFS